MAKREIEKEARKKAENINESNGTLIEENIPDADDRPEGKRQNRVVIVMGILTIIIPVFASIFIAALNYTKNSDIPMGDIWYKIAYFQMAAIIGSLSVILFNASVFIYNELNRNDIENLGNKKDILLKNNKYYHNFIMTINVTMGILLIVLFTMIMEYFNNVWIRIAFFVILITLFTLCKIIGHSSKLKIIILIILPILFISAFIYIYFLCYNFNRRVSNLSVNFNENGMVYIDRESLDENEIKVKITYWNNVTEEKFEWENCSIKTDELRGISGIFDSIGNTEADIKDSKYAIWNTAKAYYHYELDLNNIRNQQINSKNQKIGDFDGQYIINVIINKNSKKIVVESRFQKVQNRYIFAKDKVNMEY